MPWIIAAAVDAEIKGVREELAPIERVDSRKGKVWKAYSRETPLFLVRTGMGPKRVRAALVPLLGSGRFQGIVSIGFAGSLQQGLRVGNLVIPSEIVAVPSVSNKKQIPDRELFEALCLCARRHNRQVHTGRMLTSDRVVFSSTEKRRLGQTYDAESVEMESSVVAELAAAENLRFAAVRVISDEVGVSLPETVVLLDYIRRRNYRNIVRYIVFQPLEAARILRLIPNIRRASKDLTGFVLDGVLETISQG